MSAAADTMTKRTALWPDWYRAFWEYCRANGLPEPRRQQSWQAAYDAGLTPKQAAEDRPPV